MTRTVLPTLTFLSLLIACRPGDGAGYEQRTTAATTPAAPAADSSAVAFVRAFYAGYEPRARRSGVAALDSLLTERPATFAPPLLAALRRDAAARAAATGEIAGLDFEPLLNTQDPCERYEVAPTPDAVRPVGRAVLVEVYAVCGGARQASPAAVAEVAPAAGGWEIANVRYGLPGDDLLTVLGQLHPGNRP